MADEPCENPLPELLVQLTVKIPRSLNHQLNQRAARRELTSSPP